MTALASPGPKTTNSGAPLPLVALPQDDLLTVNIDQIPLLKDALGPGIHIQPLRLDPDKGEVVAHGHDGARLRAAHPLPHRYRRGVHVLGPLEVRRVPRPAADRGLLPV